MVPSIFVLSLVREALGAIRVGPGGSGLRRPLGEKKPTLQFASLSKVSARNMFLFCNQKETNQEKFCFGLLFRKASCEADCLCASVSLCVAAWLVGQYKDINFREG